MLLNDSLSADCDFAAQWYKTGLTDGSSADDDAAPAIVRVEEDDPVAKHISTMYPHGD